MIPYTAHLPDLFRPMHFDSVEMDIPTIDLLPFALIPERGKAMNEKQIECGKRLDECFKEHGFCYLANIFGATKNENDDEDDDVVSRVFEKAKSLFALSEEEKSTLMKWDARTNTGFSSFGTECLNDDRKPDEKETFNVRRKGLYKDLEQMGNGEGYFKGIERETEEVFNAFFMELMKATERLCVAVACALKLEDSYFFVDKFQKFDLSTLKFLHSPPSNAKNLRNDSTTSKGEALRVSEHVDFGFATFLFHDSQSLGSGLQVKKSENFAHGRDDVENGWIDIKAKKSDVHKNICILNTGALLSRWTNNLYAATAHRVVIPMDDERAKSIDRYSCAFFMDPDIDVIIETPEEVKKQFKDANIDFVDYEPLTSFEFVQMKINEMVVKD